MARVGIIGYGYWGPNLVRNFLALPGSSVSLIADLREENLRKARAMYPAIRETRDTRDLIADPETDAVAIATPVSTHYALARAALEAGKHVLVEKPMTQTSAEAEELTELAAKRGLTLLVDHTFVYTGAVRKIRELIDRGELGDLHYFDSARINLGLVQKDTNVLWDLAPHDLSILAYLIDEPPSAIQAVGYTHVGSGREEIAALHIHYGSGFHAHVRVSWLSPVKMRLTLLAGSKKMVVYDDVQPSEKVRVYDAGVDIAREEVTAFMPIYRAGDVLIPAIDRAEALSNVAKHFIDCIEGRAAPLTGGRAAQTVVRMLEAAQESMETGNRFVPLSLNAAPSARRSPAPSPTL